jgi:FtsP/CotA-like multicopper oxidase with cupredoxin domain
MPKSRVRRALRRVVVGALALALVSIGAVAYVWWTAPIDTVGKVEFDQALRIPELLEPTYDDDGTAHIELRAQEGETAFIPGENPTSTWGFNGSYLGPTIRLERGDDVTVDVVNELDEATTVHWHGMHLPAEMDGGPHQMIAPDGTWRPSWTVDQPAGTLWYHPHPHGETEDHVSRGLAGMIWLDDPGSAIRDQLPRSYGVDDVPVIVQDVEFEGGRPERGSSFLSQPGALGDEILVNGTYGPYFDVTTELVRLRLLNASTARVYDFGFADDRAFNLIGTDGGLLPAPVELERLMLSPGERAEIVVRFRPGERVALRSYPPDLRENFLSEPFDGGSDRFDVLELRAADRLAPSPSLPERLAAAPDLADPGVQEPDRTFELAGRSINGQKMDMGRIDEVVELGDTEVWEVRNVDGGYHNFHVHDVQFQVLSIDGAPPPAALGGWKDTVLVRPGEAIQLAVRFSDYADPDTPYMYHCHLLMHEDHGMMGQFVVVQPGTSAAGDISGASAASPHHPDS